MKREEETKERKEIKKDYDKENTSRLSDGDKNDENNRKNVNKMKCVEKKAYPTSNHTTPHRTV